MIIDGKKISEEILAHVAEKKTKKFFAAFLIGENPASVSFLKQKEKIAHLLNINFRIYKFEEQITQDKLRKEILKIAEHKTCGGVIVQLPLPAHINAQYVMNVIPKEKDVDVLGERALGAFYAGRNIILPPAVGVVAQILKTENILLDTKKIAIVGLGNLVGKPIAVWLKGKVSDIHLLDKGSDYSILKNADVVVLGTGQPNLISPKMLKENTFVIDFGYGTKDGKIYGDFDSQSIQNSGSEIQNFSYTPTPGGTGPILVAKLFENFFTLVENQKGV